MSPVSKARRLLIGGMAAVTALVVLAMAAHVRPRSSEPGSTTPLPSAATASGTMVATPVSSPALDPEARNAGADESWWQAVSQHLEREAYAASPIPQGFQAPNRAQNLRTTFGERGIEVEPRTRGGHRPRLALRVGDERFRAPRSDAGGSLVATFIDGRPRPLPA